jgi:hypothetical protein
VTEPDEIDEQFREQFWELAGLTDRQIPEFGILAVTYIDVDGERRFNWRVADAMAGIEVEAMIDVLRNLAESVAAHGQEVEFDGPLDDPNGLMDS